MRGAGISPDTVVRRVPDLETRDMDGESVMMSIERGKYYGMDPVGSRIWELLDSPRSVSSLCDVLVEEFDIDRTQCMVQVIEFLERLSSERLIATEP